MTVTTDFPYPKDDYLAKLCNVYGGLNGDGSFDPERSWNGSTWSARVYCSRGSVLEKAGFSRLHIDGGTIEGTPASLSFLETIAYPADPRRPALVIMTNMNQKLDIGRTIVFYTDLMFHGGAVGPEASELFSGALRQVCGRYGQDFDELNRFGAGQGIMGGTAAECGFFSLFHEDDLPFVDACVHAALETYKKILTASVPGQPSASHYEQAYRSRARLIVWIIAEDYGIKLARENGVPMEFIEAYAFPPVIKY